MLHNFSLSYIKVIFMSMSSISSATVLSPFLQLTDKEVMFSSFEIRVSYTNLIMANICDYESISF